MNLSINNQSIDGKDLHHWAHDVGLSAEEEWIRDVAQLIITWTDKTNFLSLTTSGSTATPKVIRLRKTAMKQSALKTAKHFGLKAGIMTLNCLPCKFIAGKMMLIRALVSDFDQLCIAPRIELESDFRGTIDFAAMTPMQLEITLDRRPHFIHQMKQIIIGGAPILPRLEHKLQHLDTKCFATYGMTETITHIAVARINGLNRTKIFAALEGVKFDENKGNLVIEADHLDTAPIITNDQVELIDATHFRWKGRSDHVINSGGLKIHPEQVESQLHPFIRNRYIVTACPDDYSGQQVVLLIEAEPYTNEDLSKLNKGIDSLSKFLRPKRIYYVPRLKETPTGKVIRNIKLYEIRST